MIEDKLEKFSSLSKEMDKMLTNGDVGLIEMIGYLESVKVGLLMEGIQIANK